MLLTQLSGFSEREMRMVKANMFKRISDLCQPAIQLTKGIILILDQDGKIISFNEFWSQPRGIHIQS